jgi:hypothetical protein
MQSRGSNVLSFALKRAGQKDRCCRASWPLRHFARKLISACILICTMCFSVRAEDMPLWKQSGSWAIRIDTTLNYGCFMHTSYEKGTDFRIGFDKINPGNAYVIIGNDKWQSLEIGKKYELALRFDNDDPWSGVATGVSIGSKTFLMLYTSKPKFITDFMERQWLQIKYGNTTVTSLSLKGTAVAGSELINCQTQVDQWRARRNNLSDPFSRSPSNPNTDAPRPSRDPFIRS